MQFLQIGERSVKIRGPVAWNDALVELARSSELFQGWVKEFPPDLLCWGIDFVRIEIAADGVALLVFNADIRDLDGNSRSRTVELKRQTGGIEHKANRKLGYVFLTSSGVGQHHKLIVGREKPDRINVDYETRTWSWAKFNPTMIYDFGRFVDGIGVFDISDIAQLQQLVDSATRAYSSASYIPEEYDE